MQYHELKITCLRNYFNSKFENMLNTIFNNKDYYIIESYNNVFKSNLKSFVYTFDSTLEETEYLLHYMQELDKHRYVGLIGFEEITGFDFIMNLDTKDDNLQRTFNDLNRIYNLNMLNSFSIVSLEYSLLLEDIKEKTELLSSLFIKAGVIGIDKKIDLIFTKLKDNDIISQTDLDLLRITVPTVH